ncbi:MAG: FecR family protein [Flavobacterium sp.]|nr:FecR family protein [Flavobacterium sp.]
MTENSNIKTVLQKFVLDQCTPEETIEVIAYFRNKSLTSAFPTVEDIKELLGEMPQMEQSKADAIFSNILENTLAPQEIVLPIRKKHYKKYISVAAVLLILLSVGWTYQHVFFNQKQQPILTGNEITLQLENGDIQIISADGTSVVKDAGGNIIGNQNGSKIVYDAKTGLEKLSYNTIKIPYGKRFQLQLSDGTVVHLNSGTTLKYPVKFIANKNRQVFLDGEAYFDVTKDKTHPFIVNADKLNIRVLGTHFNVTNYPEDEQTDVVLVEGSVGLYSVNTSFDPSKNTVLKPGFKGSFDKNTNSIDTKPVITDFYTSWIQGRLTFKNMTFKNITKKLERHYDVVITNNDMKLSDEKFNASFGDQPIEKVLGYFSEIHAFNYTVKDKEIIIK